VEEAGAEGGRGVGDVEDDGDTVVVGGGAEAKAAVVQHQEQEDEDSGVQVPEGRHREMWWMKHAPQYFIVQTKLNSSWSWGEKVLNYIEMQQLSQQNAWKNSCSPTVMR
jgi:hypothetical protein